ncbi:hypothetical protein PGH46_00015 [Legionella pneumophila]|nr:hypothetical protein PGH46_00015 [Legionella pneumophila]
MSNRRLIPLPHGPMLGQSKIAVRFTRSYRGKNQQANALLQITGALRIDGVDFFIMSSSTGIDHWF